MSYSVTGVAYLTLLSAVGYLTYRLFQYWRKEKDAVSKQLFYFVSLFGLFALVKAIGGLFFADNSFFLVKTIEIGVFIQAFALAAIAYNIIYLKFPKISPWFGFIPVLILGLIAAILAITSIQHNPFLESSGAINWGLPSDSITFSISLLRFFIFMVTCIPLIIIFLLQFKNSEESYLKRKALGLSFVLIFMLIGALLDFILIGSFNLNPLWRDITFTLLSVTLLITLLLTLPRPLPKI